MLGPDRCRTAPLLVVLAEAELGRGDLDAARKAAATTERARLNVTRALRTSIARIGELAPQIGGHLDRAVRTGVYCTYSPAPSDAVSWS